MGQLVAVEQKAGGASTIVRFETNRSLTGMGHERFTSAAEAKGPRPAAVIARRFFEAGHVSWVHVYGNCITASLEAGASQASLNEIVRDLYQYWKPGMVPPTLEELLASMPAEVAPAASSSGDSAAPAGEDPRIPPHLFERSRNARARLAAK
ncbi:MAG: hypothetical protein WCG33_07375 [Actinomycetes bacterium]|jgi:hypothetical protein